MQTKKQSLYESITNIVVGMVLNYIANATILPLFFEISLKSVDYIKLTLIYTVISLIRSYGLRRYYNVKHNKDDI